MDQIQDLFDEFDTDSSGSIDREEVGGSPLFHAPFMTERASAK